MATTSTERHTAAERRDEILDAALNEFAERGLHGTSTDRIARRAGISQPYLFRLFGRKKETQSKGLWLTGIILGSIGLAVAALSLIFWIIIGVSGGFSDNGTNYNFNYDPNSLNS